MYFNVQETFLKLALGILSSFWIILCRMLERVFIFTQNKNITQDKKGFQKATS